MAKSKKKETKTKKVSAQVTCPHCGKEYETQVEVPEPSETPKMAWAT